MLGKSMTELQNIGKIQAKITKIKYGQFLQSDSLRSIKSKIWGMDLMLRLSNRTNSLLNTHCKNYSQPKTEADVDILFWITF